MKGRIENTQIPVDERGEERRRLYLPSSAVQADGTSAVEILDLSATGLLVSTAAQLAIDEPVAVVLADGTEHRAQIMWHTGRLYGCRFEQALSRVELGANLLRAHPPRDLPETPADMAETLGSRLHRLRAASPYTMSELARLAGVTKPTLWKWETGKSRPRHDALVRLADVLGVTEAELLYGRDTGEARSGSPGATDPGGDRSLAAIVAAARRAIAGAAGVDPRQVSISIDFN